MICNNISVNDSGELLFAGQNTLTLARQYGTPLYLLDEAEVRRSCRIYREAMGKHFGPDSLPLYASKANAFKRIYEIVQEEGLGIDVVSCGEIYTARLAGFDLSRAYFHGNCKTDEDIRFAMDNGVGYFIADNREELCAIEEEAARRGLRQKLLLRLTPGIDTHTYAAIATGQVDSKFGTAIETGQAEELTVFALAQPHLELMGFHCHVGSQVFEEDVFERSAEIMLNFCAMVQEKYGFLTKQLDLGGGYGVPYLEEEPTLDIDAKIGQVAAYVKAACARLGISMPEIHMEPGRSIVAAAGMTLYTVASVKTITGYKSYIGIDGGMTDNPRFALYGAEHTCLAAGRMQEPCDFLCSVVGRCCESGDIIREDVLLPSTMKRGDILAVCTTGAYNYSMASNYNRLGRPPVVMLRDGDSYLAVRREGFADLCQYDV